jgi:hypothetical protein
LQVLRAAEVQGQDGTRRIIDGPEEEQGRAGSKPVERAAVDEDEGAHGRVAWPPRPVLRRPAAPLRGQTERPAKPADGAQADGQPVRLSELFGRVAAMELAVRGLDARDDPVADRDVQLSARWPAPAPVDQPPDPLGPIPGFEAPNLTRGQLQCPRPRDGCDLPGHPYLHHSRSAGCLATHRDGLPWACRFASLREWAINRSREYYGLEDVFAGSAERAARMLVEALPDPGALSFRTSPTGSSPRQRKWPDRIWPGGLNA